MVNDSAYHKLTRLPIHIDGAYSPNTLRAHKSDILEFIAYCHKLYECALPAEPKTVGVFLRKNGPRHQMIHHSQKSFIQQRHPPLVLFVWPDQTSPSQS